MEHITTVETLTNPNNDAMIEKFFAVMGNKVKIVACVWSEDDIDKDYSFPDKGSQTVAWGDDEN